MGYPPSGGTFLKFKNNTYRTLVGERFLGPTDYTIRLDYYHSVKKETIGE